MSVKKINNITESVNKEDIIIESVKVREFLDAVYKDNTYSTSIDNTDLDLTFEDFLGELTSKIKDWYYDNKYDILDEVNENLSSRKRGQRWR